MKNKVHFIEIRIIQNIFVYKNYLFIKLSLKEAIATKSKS